MLSIRTRDDDAGFTLIETMVSVFVMGVVMSALTSFFATTVLLTNQQGGVQVATQLASDAVSRVRALKGSGLVA
ncbi:MAG TPA: prepilin-type N-terminal cleavage/methylation domain-containing protein, partial [Actinoplanes sp.]